MLISRAPLRVSLAGGGTDLPGFADRHGGLVLGTSIDQYVTVVRERRRDGRGHRLCLDRCAVHEAAHDVSNPFAREALVRFWDGGPLELASFGDVPPGTGMGSSAAFTVALLGALRPDLGPWELAESASVLEIEHLGRPVGRQDQYLSALGGPRVLRFGTGGDVTTEPLDAPAGTLERLERELLLFYTGVQRDAGQVLAEQSRRSAGGESDVDDLLGATKAIAVDVVAALRRGDSEAVGTGLARHWALKRRLGRGVSLDQVDVALQRASQAGATGGKLLGAGGGGHVLVHCAESRQASVRQAFAAVGFHERRFSFDTRGHRVDDPDRLPPPPVEEPHRRPLTEGAS